MPFGVCFCSPFDSSLLPLSSQQHDSFHYMSSSPCNYLFVDFSGLTMRGSKLLVQTELRQSGCWDAVPEWGFKVSNAGITTTTDCQLGLWADTRSRGLTLLNPASCTEGSTIWVSVTVWRILCFCPCLISISLCDH